MTRISRAMTSDDLAHYDRPCDADTLQATGLSSIRQPLGVLLIEALEGAAGDSQHDAARVRDLQAAIRAMAMRASNRFKVRIDLNGVAALIVRELLFSHCPNCMGRGHVPLRYDGAGYSLPNPGEDYEADCPVCLGSGKDRRNTHARARAAGHREYGRELDALWTSLLDWCAEAEARARGSVFKRLKR